MHAIHDNASIKGFIPHVSSVWEAEQAPASIDSAVSFQTAARIKTKRKEKKKTLDRNDGN